jgi:uncharacterized membrane protein YdcZ (DUF606 family)
VKEEPEDEDASDLGGCLITLGLIGVPLLGVAGWAACAVVDALFGTTIIDHLKEAFT